MEDEGNAKQKQNREHRSLGFGFLSGCDSMDIQIQMQTDGYRYRSGTFSDIVVSGYITFRYGCCALPCERSGQTERKIPR